MTSYQVSPKFRLGAKLSKMEMMKLHKDIRQDAISGNSYL